MVDMAKHIPINYVVLYCSVLCLTWSQILNIYFLASRPIQDPFTHIILAFFGSGNASSSGN